MPHCQTFHACLAIMMKTDARLLLVAFRPHSQTLFFRKRSRRSHTPVYSALVLNLSRTSCCHTDSPVLCHITGFPAASKQAKHATDNIGPFPHLHCFSGAREVSTWNFFTPVLCHGVITYNSTRSSVHSIKI